MKQNGAKVGPFLNLVCYTYTKKYIAINIIHVMWPSKEPEMGGKNAHFIC